MLLYSDNLLDFYQQKDLVGNIFEKSTHHLERICRLLFFPETMSHSWFCEK